MRWYGNKEIFSDEDLVSFVSDGNLSKTSIKKSETFYPWRFFTHTKNQITSQYFSLPTNKKIVLNVHDINPTKYPPPHSPFDKSVQKKIWIIPAQWLQNINNVEMAPRWKEKRKLKREWYAQRETSLSPFSIQRHRSMLLYFTLQTAKNEGRRWKKIYKINFSKLPADKIMKIERKESDRTTIA
jgi:hypothetical protein